MQDNGHVMSMHSEWSAIQVDEITKIMSQR